MNLKFRPLRADEVQARVNTVSAKGHTLLLYKDARCDQDILDETVGPMNWQRRHYEVKGNMYCSVGIRDSDTGEWTWKDDCGTESNTEAQKGEASDSFKRACVNWGIGRELYTKLFIWIPGGTEPTGQRDKRGRDIYKLSDPFSKYTVLELESAEGKITHCVILRGKEEVYRYTVKSCQDKPIHYITPEQQEEIKALAKEKWGENAGARFKATFGYKSMAEIPAGSFDSIMTGLRYASNETA